MSIEIRKDEKIKNIGKELANIGVDKGYGTFQYISAGSNCKVCHIDDIANAVGNNLNNMPIFAERLNELFKKNKKLCFTVNVSFEEYQLDIMELDLLHILDCFLLIMISILAV